jgi:hypothetical protein
MGKDLKPFFDQYLRTTQVPVLEWYRHRRKLWFRLTHSEPGLHLPLTLENRRKSRTIEASTDWQSIPFRSVPQIRPDYLLRIRQVPQPE